MIAQTFDTTAQRCVAFFEAPTLDVAVRIARNTAKLHPDSFPNGPDSLFTCVIDPREVPAAHRATLARFGEVVLPPVAEG